METTFHRQCHRACALPPAVRGIRALVLGAVTLACSTPGVLAQGRTMPPPPKTPVKTYQPDAETCRSENLLRAYRQQLQTFADQPPEVLVRLRRLQLELGEASLKRCANENRISREEADRIWRELQAIPMPQPSGSQPQPSGSQRP